MTYLQITELLDRYWEGATSLEEERQLKAYFRGKEVDERLRHYQPLFTALVASKNIQAPPHLGASSPLHPSAGSNGSFRRLLLAASLTGLVVSAWWWFQPAPHQPEQATAAAPMTVEPVEQVLPKPVPVQASIPVRKRSNPKRARSEQELQPEEAAAIIKSALALVSNKMKRGQSDTEKGMNKVKVLDQYIPNPTGG
jgi:hypothetical protein